MQFAEEKTGVVKRTGVVIREKRYGDDLQQNHEREYLVNDGRFVGSTVAHMLAKLAENPALVGGVITHLSIANPNYRNTSLDQNLLDYDIYEEVDPNGYREFAEDSLIEPVDYIQIVYVFYDQSSAEEAAKELEINPWGFPIHEVGSVFIDHNHPGELAHIVKKVESDPLPTDEDAPSYQAVCGVWGSSYGTAGTMGNFSAADFIAESAHHFDHHRFNCCPECFRNE